MSNNASSNTDSTIDSTSVRRVKPDGTLGRKRIGPPAPYAAWFPDDYLDDPDNRWRYVCDVWSYPLRWLRWRLRDTQRTR